ncbi:ubiquitin family protein [Actinidia rufa]|uniref:Ubiquitin family protein n=1 Tax=Actinidia rufa TaxID=165716 RepID=A0A7J0DBJ2_9ERIC|nr:ubiquitin family protein [Actinidia rufa]
MKITVTLDADQQIVTLDVDRDESVENLKALLEVETQVPLQRQQLLFNGKEMSNADKLSALGVNDGDLIMMISQASSSVSTNDLSLNSDGSAVNPAAFQQQIRSDSNMMAQLFQADPELAQVLLGNDLNKLQDLLRQNPFDVEAQKKIEAAIRQKGIDENWAAAIEHNPEGFARVVMLYVDPEVNGVPLKVVTRKIAWICVYALYVLSPMLLRLLDQRYKGIAHGVGQSEILGRIHVAPIKIGNIFYPCSFLVLDSPNMDFLFGLNMLRKHQCTIDLKENILRVGGGEVSVPFLQGWFCISSVAVLFGKIPSHYLDEERKVKEASSSGAQVRIFLISLLVHLEQERIAVYKLGVSLLHDCRTVSLRKPLMPSNVLEPLRRNPARRRPWRDCLPPPSHHPWPIGAPARPVEGHRAKRKPFEVKSTLIGVESSLVRSVFKQISHSHSPHRRLTIGSEFPTRSG